MALRVFFNEYNIRMGKMCYLPLVSGVLQAYAQTSEAIRTNFNFMRPIFALDSFDAVMAHYREAPDIAAFSVSMWNEQLNLRVAAEVKRRWPNSLIVLGGSNVPHNPTDYMTRYPFVDVAVKAEGEEPFRDILHRRLENREFEDIPGVSFRRRGDGEIIVCRAERPFSRDLEAYPSPYLEGIFDELLAMRSDSLDFQAIVETNRGCPFQCTFCYWGRGGLSRKYRYHGMDRVLAEIDWFGRNEIPYVFNADSNFGMHKRDPEIAEFIISTKKKYGFPDKFRTCFGKNTDEQIFRLGRDFHRAGLEKGITLSRQSNDKTTLKNVKRGNIKMSTYINLQARFNDENIPVYSEMILGLPGETVETWKRGIEEMLDSGLKNQLFIYLCQVFNNTELGEPEYLRKFGMRTKRIELNEIHGSVRDSSWVKEYETIVFATDTMSYEQWRDMLVFSWLTMLLHSMKVGYYVLIWLRDRFGLKSTELIDFLSGCYRSDGETMLARERGEYDAMLDRMISNGAGRGVVMPTYGDIYWDVEEASFLRISENLDRFYAEFRDAIGELLSHRGLAFDPRELAEVIRYQQSRIPAANLPADREHKFSYNLPEYFEQRNFSHPAPLLAFPQTMTAEPIDFAGDRQRFARETILWGRKSGTMLTKVKFEPISAASLPAGVGAATSTAALARAN